MKGFTLIELMTVLGILSILAMISISIGPGMIQKSKERAELREFISECRKSQMHAIKTNQNVVLKITGNSYQFFADPNKNFTLDPGEDQTIIRTFQSLEITNITSVGKLAFDSRGICVADNKKIATPMAEINFSNKYNLNIFLTGVIKV